MSARGGTYEGVGADRWVSDADVTGVARAAEVVQAWLPKGQLLPEHIWRRRHGAIVGLLWFHVPALFAFGLIMGNSLQHMLIEVAALIGPAWIASAERVRIKLRVAAASFGLASCSAMLVHLSGGYIEAHFHFFVMIGVLTLYQDWMPFLLAIVYVVVHHAAVGLGSPESVYNHPDAIANR